MVVGGVVLLAAFTVYAVSLRFLNATALSGPDVQPQERGPPVFSIQSLPNADAPVDSLSDFVGTFVDAMALVLFAQSVGSEYAWGTLRTNLAVQPRRLLFLTGKLLGLAACMSVVTAMTWATCILSSVAFGIAMEVPMGNWWSGAGLAAMIGSLLRVAFTAIVWGCLGTLLAVAFRSPAIAIAAGLGYQAFVENLVAWAVPDVGRWLPGQLLGVFNGGSDQAVAWPLAGLLLLGYGAAFVAAQWRLFERRDVLA